MSRACFVHESIIGDIPKSFVRTNVCKDLPAEFEHDGNAYCVLHYPRAHKDSDTDFLNVVQAKLNKLEFDFSYTYITSAATFFAKTFPGPVILMNATFDCRATFINNKYEYPISFENANFLQDVDFSRAVFSQGVRFSGAIFKGKALFQHVVFGEGTDFSTAVFESWADFDVAIFLDTAGFVRSHFKSEAVFRHAAFLGSIHDFGKARFDGLTDFMSAIFFGEIHFRNAKFDSWCIFSYVIFLQPTYFDSASFSKTTQFFFTNFCSGVNFDNASFPETAKVEFEQTQLFGIASFNNTIISGFVTFSGKAAQTVFLPESRRSDSKSRIERKRVEVSEELKKRNVKNEIPTFDEEYFDAVLVLQNIQLEKPERMSFYRVSLRPAWFINADARKMIFTDVTWQNCVSDLRNKNIESEVRDFGDQESEPRRLLEIAVSQLAVNAEENNRYDEASRFRYMAAEIRRIEDCKTHNISRILSWLYKWTSGYGESWSWAALVLIGIWFGFGLIYWLFGEFYSEIPQNFYQSLGYSSLVMLLQKPEPRPLSNLTFTLYILETIFAPLQAALLALAIRRKFMR